MCVRVCVCKDCVYIFIRYLTLHTLLNFLSRPGRDTVCQGKGKFGKLGGGKSCSVVYGSAWSSGCDTHGPNATATI